MSARHETQATMTAEQVEQYRADPEIRAKVKRNYEKAVSVPHRIVLMHGEEVIDTFEVEPYRYRWAERGVRYDEECSRCRKVCEVDNWTDLCERCYGGPHQ